VTSIRERQVTKAPIIPHLMIDPTRSPGVTHTVTDDSICVASPLVDSGNPEYNGGAGFVHCKCGTELCAPLLEQEEIVHLRIERRGLRTKVIVWAFVPMAIVLNAVTLFAFYTYQRVTEELVVERNQELTRLLAGQLSIRLIDYVEMLGDLAKISEIQDGSQVAWQDLLDANAGQFHAFDGGIAIVDTAGTVVAAHDLPWAAIGEDWSDRTFLRRPDIDPEEFRFSDNVRPGPLGEGVIAVAVPIDGNTDRAASHVVGLFRVRGDADAGSSLFYTALSRKLQDWRGGDVYLVDGTGRAIYHSDLSRIGESMVAQDGVSQVLVGETRAFRTRDLSGEQIVIGLAPVPGTVWGLVTEESWSDLIETSQGYRRLLLVFLTAGLIVPIFLIVLGVRQITQPIVELTSAAQEMAEGDFEQRIVARTGDELEDLAEQFNRMTAQLRELYASLEQRVADRTRELSALYQVATVARATLDLDEILDRSLEQVLAVMDCEMGMVHLLDEESGMLRLAAWHGTLPDTLSRTAVAPMEQGLIAWVFEQKEPVIVPRIADSPRPFIALSAECDQTYAGAPMRTTERTVGVLSIIGAPGQQLDPEERALLAAVADQIAVTVENVRLRAETERVVLLQERERLARDLHDSVTQSLYSLTLWIEAGQRSTRAGDLAHVEEYLARLEEGTRQAVRDMRLLVYELRPPALEDDGLVGALQERLDAVEKRSGIQVQLVVQDDLELPAKVEEGLYRIAEEALNNALKHARSSAIVVRLYAKGDEVELEITDDGIGFDRDAGGDTGGMGLVNMHQRAVQLGGILDIVSSPGEGTCIRAAIPRNVCVVP
jgi:nitrate/nitrite-specific signal transduction histidine kinase